MRHPVCPETGRGVDGRSGKWSRQGEGESVRNRVQDILLYVRPAKKCYIYFTIRSRRLKRSCRVRSGPCKIQPTAPAERARGRGRHGYSPESCDRTRDRAADIFAQYTETPTRSRLAAKSLPGRESSRLSIVARR